MLSGSVSNFTRSKGIRRQPQTFLLFHLDDPLSYSTEIHKAYRLSAAAGGNCNLFPWQKVTVFCLLKEHFYCMSVHYSHSTNTKNHSLLVVKNVTFWTTKESICPWNKNDKWTAQGMYSRSAPQYMKCLCLSFIVGLDLIKRAGVHDFPVEMTRLFRSFPQVMLRLK